MYTDVEVILSDLSLFFLPISDSTILPYSKEPKSLPTFNSFTFFHADLIQSEVNL